MRWIVWGFLLVSCSLWAQEQALPKYATEAEKAMGPTIALRKTTPPPSGPIQTPAEYDPVEGILLSYQGSSSWKSILDQMAAQITTLGNADVYVMADSASEATTILTNMTNAGAVASRVKPLVAATDSIWIRDYGPRYVYEGNCRSIIDHTYNRPRPNDDAQPFFFGNYKHHTVYEIPLVHGGGNYHLHTDGEAHATRLINNENPDLTEQEIHDLWLNYQNVDTHFYTPFPTSIDSTQHIDMWMIALADHTSLISDWPNNAGSTQDQICDSTAQSLINAGYAVTRIPAFSVGGTHYTYTNAVICNDLVLVPSYTNSTVAPHNSEALTIWQNAMPGKTIVQINCQAIVTAAGVMHCIAMHVPVHLGGQNPTAYLQTRFEGQTLQGGNTANLRWISDDNMEVMHVDLAYSVDNGPFTEIANSLPALGNHTWNIPQLNSNNVRLRVTAWDAAGLSGIDTTAPFSVAGTVCRGDAAPLNGGDGIVDQDDLLVAIGFWLSSEESVDVWPATGPNTWGDGAVDIRDLVQILDLFGSCP